MNVPKFKSVTVTFVMISCGNKYVILDLMRDHKNGESTFKVLLAGK